MTVSDHRVTGVTQSPVVAFSPPGGTVGLDVARWPFVQGALSVPIKAGLFDALDPRTGPQRVTLSCADVLAGSSRVFDLGVRGVSAGMDDTLSVEVASDEALLEDYSNDEDVQPWMFPEVYLDGPSAYTLSQFALDRIGATLPVLPPWIEERRNLEEYPADAATGTTYWLGTRVALTNPGGYLRGVCNVAGAGLGGTGVVSGTVQSRVAVSPGDVVRVTAEARTSAGATSAVAGVQFFDAAGAFISGTQLLAPPTLTDAVAWTELDGIVSAPAPAAAVTARPVFYIGQVGVVGMTLDIRRVTIEKTSARLGAPFTANMTAPDAFTRYRWIGTADASASVLETATDRSLEPYWELTNKAVNPRFNTTTKGAALSSGASALTAGVTYLGLKGLRWAFPATGATARVYVAGHDPVAGTMTAIPVDGGAGLEVIGDSPDDRYLYVHANTASSAATSRRALFVQFRYKENPNVTRLEVVLNETTASGWNPVQGVVKIPRGEYYLVVGVDTSSPSGGTPNAYATDVCIVEHFGTIIPFNGSTPPTPDYTHEWDGVPDDSTSTRYPVREERLPDSLVWRAGVGGMSYLVPLLQSVGMRLVCDENRQWTLRSIDHTEPGSVALTYGGNLLDYSLDASLDDWCDAATVVYKWKSNGVEFTRVDRFELNTPPRRSVYREIEMTYPGPGRAENIVRRAQSTPGATSGTAVTLWVTTPEQPITMTTPAKTVTGTIGAVTFNLDDDEMTVSVRTQDTA